MPKGSEPDKFVILVKQTIALHLLNNMMRETINSIGQFDVSGGNENSKYLLDCKNDYFATINALSTSL